MEKIIGNEEISKEQIMQYPVHPDDCFSAEEVQQEQRRKGKDSKTWGKNALEDPTSSGVGEKIHELMSSRPSSREWKKLQEWKEQLTVLYTQYNKLVGFEAFGLDID